MYEPLLKGLEGDGLLASLTRIHTVGGFLPMKMLLCEVNDLCAQLCNHILGVKAHQIRPIVLTLIKCLCQFAFLNAVLISSFPRHTDLTIW